MDAQISITKFNKSVITFRLTKIYRSTPLITGKFNRSWEMVFLRLSQTLGLR